MIRYVGRAGIFHFLGDTCRVLVCRGVGLDALLEIRTGTRHAGYYGCHSVTVLHIGRGDGEHRRWHPNVSTDSGTLSGFLHYISRNSSLLFPPQ